MSIVQPTVKATAGVINGMNLILKYERDAEIAAVKDKLYFGTFGITSKKMRPELLSMDNWGWYEEEESWAIHI